MQTKKVEIAEATDDELRVHLANVQGVTVPANAKTETLIAKIRASGWEADHIVVMVADEVTEEAPKPHEFKGAPPPQPEGVRRDITIPDAPQGGTPGAHDPVVELTISEQDKPGGKRAIPVGVNGTYILIARAKPQAVPYRYYLVLANAIEKIYEQEETQPNGQPGELTEREVPSYPFNVTKMPSDDEIAAFDAANWTIGIPKAKLVEMREAAAEAA